MFQSRYRSTDSNITLLTDWKYVCASIGIMTCILTWNPPTASGQPTGLEVDSLSVGQTAPAFVMKRMGSMDWIRLSDYAGELRPLARAQGATKQVVVLSFFSSTCKPCEEEMPQLTEISKTYKDRDLQVFFVNMGETEAVTSEWLRERPMIQGAVVMDQYLEWAKRFGVDSLPRTIIIDKDGMVRHIEKGFASEYRERITTILELLLPFT